MLSVYSAYLPPSTSFPPPQPPSNFQVAVKVSLDRWTGRNFQSEEDVALFRATGGVRSRCEDEYKVSSRLVTMRQLPHSHCNADAISVDIQ
jgi:hypothetical protein